MTTYEADWVCPVSSAPVRNGSLRVEGDRIVEVSAAGEDSTVRFPGCAIIPGFVNAHTHLELTLLRGFLEDLPFTEWVRTLTRTKYVHLSHDELLLSARLGAAEMVAAGVTCLGEVMDVGTALTAMREAGLRGIAYQEVFGPDEALAVGQFDELKARVAGHRRFETETLRIGVSPHAPYTVCPPLFRNVRDFARKENLPITIHIAESQEEGLFVRFGGGPLAERLAERGFYIEPPGVSPISYMDSLDLVAPDTLLIHVIDVEDEDLETLGRRKPMIVHCPKSNAKLAHGVARISEIMEKNVIIGLGTDSVASNNVVDMFEEMRSAIFQQRARTGRLESMDAAAAFWMATAGGAECLGLSHLVGTLEAGKLADFVVVDLNDLGIQPVYDPITSMVYSASRRNVRATYIGGREVRLDTADLIPQSALIASRLKEGL